MADLDSFPTTMNVLQVEMEKEKRACCAKKMERSLLGTPWMLCCRLANCHHLD